MAIAETKQSTGAPEEDLKVRLKLDPHSWEIGIKQREPLPPALRRLALEVRSWFKNTQGWELVRISGTAENKSGKPLGQTLIEFLEQGLTENSAENFTFIFLLTSANPPRRGFGNFREVDVSKSLSGRANVTGSSHNSHTTFIDMEITGFNYNFHRLRSAIEHPGQLYLESAKAVTGKTVGQTPNHPWSNNIEVELSFGNLHKFSAKLYEKVKGLQGKELSF